MRIDQGDNHGIIPDLNVGRLVTGDLDHGRLGRILPERLIRQCEIEDALQDKERGDDR